MSISSVIKSIQDIMRKDAGVDGDAQRLSQLSWLLFLKVFDAKSKHLRKSVFLKTKNTRRLFLRSFFGASGLLTLKA